MASTDRDLPIFSFEADEIGPELDLVPLAARRALDASGLRLPLDGWRSLSLNDRRALALAGAAEVVDAAAVVAVVGKSSPQAERMSVVSDPDPRALPPELLAAVIPPQTLDKATWARLRSLDRYALAHALRRSKARADLSIVEAAVEAILRERADSAAPAVTAPTSMAPSTTPMTAPTMTAPAKTTPAPAAMAPAMIAQARTTPAVTARAGTGPAVTAPPVTAPARTTPAVTAPAVMAPAVTTRAAPEPSSATPQEPLAISSHLNARGDVHMVDVGEKSETVRRAVASGLVSMRPETAARIARADAPKGEVLATARVAGILAAKRTPELIPLCHAIALTHVAVQIEVSAEEGLARVTATAEARDRTGVEMEALVAASVACLTIYDMLKGLDREMVIADIKLLEKSGGRSGHFVRTERADRGERAGERGTKGGEGR